MFLKIGSLLSSEGTRKISLVVKKKSTKFLKVFFENLALHLEKNLVLEDSILFFVKPLNVIFPYFA